MKSTALLHLFFLPLLTFGQTEFSNKQSRALFNLFSLNHSSTSHLKSKILEHQIEDYEKDLGLSFTARASLRLNKENGQEPSEWQWMDETNPNNIYSIKWELLGNGLRSNRLMKKRAQTEADLLEKMAESNSRRENASLVHANIIYTFNKLKLGLEKAHLQNLREVIKQEEMMVALQKTNRSQLLETNRKINNLLILINRHTSFNQSFRETFGPLHPISADNLPILKVNLDAIIKNPSLQQNHRAIQGLQKEIQQLNQKASSNSKLNITGSYNQLIGRNDFPSFHINFTTPLTGRSKIKEIHRTENMLLDQEVKIKSWNREKELLNIYYEYEFKLKQLLDLKGKTKVWEDKLRQLQIKQRLNFDPNQLDVLYLRVTLEELKIEALNVKEQLYILLSKIYLYSEHLHLKDFSIELNTNETVGAMKIAGLPTLDIEQSLLLDYLRYNEISLLISKVHLEPLLIQDLKTLEIEVIVSPHFNLFESITAFTKTTPGNILWVKPESFNSRLDLEKHLKENQDQQPFICFPDLNKLIQLDIKTSKLNETVSTR